MGIMAVAEGKAKKIKAALPHAPLRGGGKEIGAGARKVERIADVSKGGKIARCERIGALFFASKLVGVCAGIRIKSYGMSE